MHGEYASFFLEILPSLGSPPYAWGILFILKLPFFTMGITPICMGNTTIDAFYEAAF